MSGTPEGGQTLRQTMIEKHGSEEAWRQHMAGLGRKGGANGHTGGFHNNPELARIAGAKGGRIGRRKSKKAIDG